MCHGTLVKTLCDHCNSFIAGLHSRLRCQDSARVECKSVEEMILRPNVFSFSNLDLLNDFP